MYNLDAYNLQDRSEIAHIIAKNIARYNVTDQEIAKALVYAEYSSHNNIIPGEWPIDGLDMVCALTRVIRERK